MTIGMRAFGAAPAGPNPSKLTSNNHPVRTREVVTLLLSHRKLLIAITVLALVATACGTDGGATTTTAADTGTTARPTRARLKAKRRQPRPRRRPPPPPAARPMSCSGPGQRTRSTWRRCRRSSISSTPWAVRPPNWCRSPGTETEATALITAVRGGTGPDVYMLDRFTVAQRAADGLLEDLTQFDDNPLEGYIAFAAEEATFDGKAYALPFDTDTRALYYNIGMLEEAGIDPAELDPANGPVTWDRVMEIANQLNEDDADGNYTRMGFIPWQTWSNGQGWHYTYGFSWGADFFDEAGCRVTPDDPNNVEAFQWIYDQAAALGCRQDLGVRGRRPAE